MNLKLIFKKEKIAQILIIKKFNERSNIELKNITSVIYLQNLYVRSYDPF